MLAARLVSLVGEVSSRSISGIKFVGAIKPLMHANSPATIGTADDVPNTASLPVLDVGL